MAFKIGKNFHIIHITDDLKALDAWYYDVFSCQRFMPDSYMKSEVRDASLVLIGELCIEPWRRHPGDRESEIVEIDLLADDVGPAAEPLLPVSIADHGDRTSG